MFHRIRPGLARTLVQAAVLVLACLLRVLVPVPGPLPSVVRRPPGYRVLVAGAEIPALPPYLLRFRKRTAAPTPRPAARIRPYLVATSSACVAGHWSSRSTGSMSGPG